VIDRKQGNASGTMKMVKQMEAHMTMICGERVRACATGFAGRQADRQTDGMVETADMRCRRLVCL